MYKQLSLFDVEPIGLDDSEKMYSRNVSTPIYTPKKGSKLYECFDATKYFRLLRKIDNSNVGDDEKQFLKLAAARFVVFNYENIADYYAASNQEMQNLMEQLALVIIDFDKAIENGFVQLNDKMRQLYEQELD